MEKLTEFFVNNRNKIIAWALVLVVIALAGFTTIQILTPLDETSKKRLTDQILGKKIQYDSRVIEQVEKLKDYGRSINTDYVLIKRRQLGETGVPDNFFSANRLDHCFNKVDTEEC